MINGHVQLVTDNNVNRLFLVAKATDCDII